MRDKLLALALVVSPCVILLAQSSNAILSGTVTDPSGAPIVGAKVVAKGASTGVSTGVATNESGLYVFPPLSPGKYDLTISHPGFRQYTARSLVLEVGGRVKSDAQLDIGSLTESVEVVASAESPLETISASVGNVVTSQRIQDLPLEARDAAALIALQAGVVGDNFNGMRTMSQNVTFDGINIQETRYNGGYTENNLVITNSVDRVAEFRVVTAPADAEYGRGAGQVIMTSRSGTNKLHGSIFEYNRVTALSANQWFNNLEGRNPDGTEVIPRDFLIRNQFGARAGGPVVKNRTFWHFLYEGQRQTTKEAVNEIVYTNTARQGIFRFFPGARNANANSANRTVDVDGNPVRPRQATGDLASVSVFGRDPNRMAADPTGSVARTLAVYPSPNNFQRGDGLNTAGFLWQRRASADNDLYNLKIDHVISEKHRAAVNWHWEHGRGLNGFRGATFPTSQEDYQKNWTHYASLNLTSTLRPNLINELRGGFNRFRSDLQSPWVVGGTGILPSKGNQPFFFDLLDVTDVYDANMAPQGRTSPIYQIANSTTYVRGTHTLKAGAEARFGSSNGFNSFYVTPAATIGAGATSVQGISNIQGIGNNAAGAENLLLNLSGSLQNWIQQFNSPGGKDPAFLAGENNQRTWRQREYSFFVKDDWKATSRLTLNLGIRWEYYGVPFEANGKSAIPANGSGGVFGLSGTTFGDMFQPGRLKGSPTEMRLVGPKTQYPDTPIYRRDWNNFAPAVGLSYALPWFGKNKTVFRAGYGMTYDRNQLRNIDIYTGDVAGINQRRTYTQGTFLNVANIPLPVQPQGRPLAIIPVTDRSQTLRVFDTNLVAPYNQTWNASLQRELPGESTLTLRYVGTKGTKLFRSTNVNEANIFENGLLEAFQTTQRGGDAPLFDLIFDGLTINRQRVDGVSFTGSDYARTFSTTAGYLAMGNAGAFATWLNTQNVGGRNGGHLSRAGLPENFIVANPQYSAAYLLGNYGNSTYNGLQIEFEKRFATGWSYQGNYTFSKALGDYEASDDQYYEDSFRSIRNRRFDRRLMDFHRTHTFKSNGTWELPFGRGRKFGRNMHRMLDGIAGGWKLSGILTMNSGRPFDVNAEVSTFNNVSVDNTPDVVGNFPKSTGTLTFDGNGPYYFPGFKSVDDPRRGLITPPVRQRSELLALEGPDGKPVLQNPLPGTLGTLGSRYLFGPSDFNLDFTLSKTFKVTERVSFSVRTDWINATNTPSFANVADGMDRDINSPSFGRLLDTSSDARVIVLSGRITF